jgi:hypothetical protein
MKVSVFVTAWLMLLSAVKAQEIGSYLGDERFFYAETKQINQFFRRFNAEEDLEGRRLYEGDEHYRHKSYRTSYINMLFDRENASITDTIKQQFIREVTEESSPAFLNYYGGRWFAEVDARFAYEGQSQTVVLFLQLEKENLGIKWVINNIYFYPFSEMYYTDSSAMNKFLHPMSHELDFMNLVKVFQEPETVEYYFDESFRPDFKTLFLYELKKGNLKFETISAVSFHFFQLNDWYFQLKEFNRSGYNTGWLISNIARIPEDQKDMLLKYIYYED